MRIALLTTDVREYARDYRNVNPTFGTAPEALLQGFSALPEIEVDVLSCARAPMKSPEKLAPNVRFHSLYVPKIGWMRTAYQGCIRASRKKLRELRPDIVHGQGTELDCGISAVCSGFPNVLTIHGNMRLIAQVNKVKPFSFGWLAARLESLTIPRSAGVVCITSYTQKAVCDLARRTWIVPNAVDASFFGITAAPPSDAPQKILCVGHICVRKNQNAFIRALDPLAQKKQFKLVFLGRALPGSAYDDEFLSLVSERSWCEHPGHADREALKQHLRSASLLALPSLEDNCPMVVLEAMAAGVPVVAGRVGGLPDLIEDSETGFFCDPLDSGSIAGAIEKGLADASAAAQIANRARLRAKQRFHPETIARRHLEVYREVLGSLEPGRSSSSS